MVFGLNKRNIEPGETTSAMLAKFRKARTTKRAVERMSPEQLIEFSEFERKELEKRQKKQQEIEKKKFRQQVLRRSQQVGASVREFGMAGQQQMQEPFSHEQEALHSMFGGGGKMWGTNMQPVNLFHDLNPRQRGETGTADMFGLRY